MFRILYIFVVLEVGTRQLLHVNVTSHPTAAQTWQQVREFCAARRNRINRAAREMTDVQVLCCFVIDKY